MSEHEKNILTVGLPTIFIIVFGTLIGSQSLEIPLFAVFISVLRTAGWRLLIFAIFGLFGLFYELNTISGNLQTTKSTVGKNNGESVDRQAVIGSSIGFGLLGILLPLCAYALGNKESVLKLSYIMITGGSGFLFVIFMMFLGAVIVRVNR